MPEVRIVRNLNVLPGKGDDYASQWEPEYDTINGQPGCVQYELFQSTRNPQNFAVLEHWESRGSFHSYWDIRKVQPIVGADCLDTAENRKVGRDGTEIYYNLKYYRFDGTNWIPADDKLSREETENDTGSVRLVINMTAKEGMTDAFVDAWAPHYDEVNAEPGCLQYELFRSTRNAQNLALLEQWQSKDAFLQHWALEQTRPSATREFSAPATERKVGRGGLEIYYKVRYYEWDGTNWRPLE